jgi:hypothetical protein
MIVNASLTPRAIVIIHGYQKNTIYWFKHFNNLQSTSEVTYR